MNAFHPDSPIKLTDAEIMTAVTSGYHWVVSISEDNQICRALIPTNSLSRKLEKPEPDAIIYQHVPIIVEEPVITMVNQLAN